VAFSSNVAHLYVVVGWKVAGRKLLWRPDGSLLWQWSRVTVELLQLLLLELPRLKLWVIAPILLLLWLTQLTLGWRVHHAVLGRSIARTTTANGSRHHPLSLFLIGLSNGLHHSFVVDGYTRQLIVRQAGELCPNNINSIE
jgi:hypothetical protein